MSDKSYCIEETVPANDQYVKEDVIPNGKRWQVSCFGGSSRETEGGRASSVALRFGTELIRKADVNGAFVNLPMDKELIGNGIKKLKIILRNNSSADVKMIAWLDVIEMQ